MEGFAARRAMGHCRFSIFDATTLSINIELSTGRNVQGGPSTHMEYVDSDMLLPRTPTRIEATTRAVHQGPFKAAPHIQRKAAVDVQLP